MFIFHPVELLETRRLLALSPFGGETPVAAPGRVLGAEVAASGDGSFIVVTSPGWDDDQITAVRYAASGQMIGEPIVLFTKQAAQGIAGTSAAIDADGDAVVAFTVLETENFDTDPGEYAVYFVRISKAGVVSSPVQVDSLDAANFDQRMFSPAVSMDASGGFFLGWMEDLDRDDHEVHSRAYDAAGTPRAAEFSTSPSAPFSDVSSLDIASKPDGSGAIFVYHFSHS